MAVLAPEATKVKQLLDEASQLSSTAFDQLTNHLIRLKTTRSMRPIGSESELLNRIQNWAPHDLLNRYRHLGDLRRAETLTSDEHEELLHLVQKVEQLQNERLYRMVELAQLRGIPLQDLVAQPEFSLHEV